MSKKVDQPCNKPICSDHEWQPLFAPPLDADRDEHASMSHGHNDFMECRLCGTIGMRDGSSSRKMLTLSQSFSNQKSREAAIWNAKQQAAKPAKNQTR